MSQARLDPLTFLRVSDGFLNRPMELFKGRRLLLPLTDPGPGSDHLGERPVRHALPVWQAPASVPPHVFDQAVDVLDELPRQARFVASPTNTAPGSAAPWMREAVLTMSPATIPWPSAPIVTADSPVRTPTRARRSGEPISCPRASTAVVRSSAVRTARSESSSL